MDEQKKYTRATKIYTHKRTEQPQKITGNVLQCEEKLNN